MKELQNILNQIIETPFIFPASATGGLPKHSWEDPGIHYWIDKDGIFTRTKKQRIVKRKPIFYGLYHFSKTNGRKVFDHVISVQEYLCLPEEEQKNYVRAVHCTYKKCTSGFPEFRWVDLDDAIKFNLYKK